MEINQFTDYSLRTLIFAGLHPDERVSIDQVAEAFAISKNHLVKVVHKLSKEGYLETFRGRGGGIRLATSPEKINIGEVVRKTEPLAVVECIKPREGTCCIKGICKLQTALVKATRAFMNELDALTLADMLENENELRSRFPG